MKNRNAINNHPQSRKGVSNRVITQQNQLNEKKIQNSNNSAKEKDENLKNLIKQYLQKNGYIRTSQTLKTQKPVKRANTVMGNHRSTNDQEKSILQMFDKGQREQFFKQTTKIFGNSDLSLKKLEFELNVYFCIYTIHPSIKKGTQMDRSSSQAFKKYIDAKGSQVAQCQELLHFFALPHIQKPQQHIGMAHVFTKQWLQKLKIRFQEVLKENIKQSVNYQKKNKTGLEDLFENYSTDKDFSQKQQDSECKENCKHVHELNESKIQNKQLLNYIDIIQLNLKDLNEVSKSNLIESNKKWFQFSKQILQLAKKAVKGQKVDKLERYQKFFGSNIDELIYNSADISIFQKNSYFTEDISLIPDHMKDISIKRFQEKKEPQLCQIDMQRIMILFSKADKPEYQKQIILVLKALKDRFYKLKNVIQRRQIIVTYQRTDICAIKPQNYHIQKKLLLDSSQKVKQFYLRLLNHITTDNLGNQYLSSSEKLIENLIGILGTTTQQVVYRKHAFGILQRFSYIKQSQVMMISFGIIPIIFRIFRSEAEQLTFSSIQYLMGLIMNLAIKKESIVNFQKHKGQILPLLLKYIDVDDAQIRGYVNGTLYVLLQMPSFRNQALKHKLYGIVQELHEKYSLKLEQAVEEDLDVDPDDYGIVIRQYKYILQRLEEEPESQSQIYQCSDEEEDEQEDDELDDISNMSYGSNSSEYIEGIQGVLHGEELLMKKFALLGPEAVREQLLTRSILDETGRKSHNMTTSINHSKRIDKVFHKNERPQTPSLLPNLDLSAPQMFK